MEGLRQTSVEKKEGGKYTQFRLAMGQILVEGGQREANLDRATQAIAVAGERDCRAVVLPECLDLGWTHPSAREFAEEIPGPGSDRLCQAAAEAGLYVTAGLTERAGRRIYNAAILINPSGEILLKCRKINLLEIARMYSVGDRLGVVETPLGVIGVNICADNFPTSLAIGHVLARMGAHFILSPCAWAVPSDFDQTKTPYGEMWKQAYGKLAQLYGLTVVGVSGVGLMTAGPWKGRRVIGCSLAVGPDGNILVQGPYGEDAERLIMVTVQARPHQVRGTAYADYLKSKGYEGP